MKRITVFIFIFYFGIQCSYSQKTEPVYSIVKESRPHSFYVEQAKLWWQEIEKDIKNEKAWLNYYKANRYARMTFPNCKSPECLKMKTWLQEGDFLKEQEDILVLIEENIPGTYTYYNTKKEGHPNSKERLNAALKANEIEPENPDIYDELVVCYEVNLDLSKRADFNKKWYKSNDVSAGILNYNYNVLASVKEGGVILTFGDNDTFPIWMLQDAMGIRRDVTVLNVHLLAISEYRSKLFEKLNIPKLSMDFPNGSNSESEDIIIDHILKNSPDNLGLYVSTPVWKHIRKYEKQLYLVGLLFEYSEDNIDNIALLKNNFENKYALDYLDKQFFSDISTGVVERMNVNYLPGIIKLYEHYQLCGDLEKIQQTKELGLLVANKAGGSWKDKAYEIFK